MKTNKRFLTALTVDEFQKLLDENVTPMQRTITANLIDCRNRVLAEPITSKINVPNFNKSRFDGYAVIAKDTFPASEDDPVALKLVGKVEMGNQPEFQITPGTCGYVPTGAMIPRGADAVVKIEFTREINNPATNETSVETYSPAVPSQGVTPIAADIKKNELLFKPGTILNTPKLGCLAATGLKTAKIYDKLKIGFFSTGNELMPPGTDLPPATIHDVNSITIKSMLIQDGFHVNDRGIIPDDEMLLKKTINEFLQENDAIICSGGTSKGKGDLMPNIIEKHQELKLYIHGVRIKPGKPLIFAMIQDKYVIILPGNPTSAIMTYLRLIRPLLYKCNRIPPKTPNKIKIVLGARIYSEFGRRELIPITISTQNRDDVIGLPIPNRSETISTLMNANGYVEIPENVEIVEKGSRMDAILF
ncbi:MAG: molybdenum cofactor synthesis domain-containing protein [Promethearchaeota archaeon]